jgi:hypothetical protein
MANTVIWKGSKALTEAPTSGLYENSKEGPRYTRQWVGPHAACIAAIPARLSVIPKSPAGFTVDNVRIEKATGGRGIMTVVLSPAPIQDYTEEGNVVLEVEWVEIQKRIETHPIFGPAGDSEHPKAGNYLLTATDRDQVAAWQAITAASERTTAYTALTDHAKELAKRLQRGQDSYVTYAPLCRRTTKYATKPTNTRCGLPDNPPPALKVAGYKYLKTADRGTRDRTWTRTEEWTGADSIDTDIYAG